ncbi:MAG: tetratricopeptide repeat protein [Candidatus Cloacimonetes bacterium]|nr:tetratricopeptide repeat protein [Candidatus Cloacimonadota bacterium]
MKIGLIIILLIISCSLYSEFLTYDKVFTNLKGIKYYDNENFEDSEKKFIENSVNYPKDSQLHFNQGNAQYKNGKFEEAENAYSIALRDKNFKDKSKAYQNLGNVKFQQKDLKNAINNYRNALIEDPANEDARYNYELTARLMNRQQQQKQQSKDDKEKKDEQKEQQQQDQQQKEEKKEKEQEQQMKEQQKKDQKKEDAEKMLKALLQKEKEEMKKEKAKLNIDKAKKGKYW